MQRELLTAEELERASAELHRSWSISPQQLVRTVDFPAFTGAIEFIDEMAPIAERLDHHPDLTLSWRTIELRLATHSAGGVTALDVELARSLDAVIDRLTGPASSTG